MKLNQRCNNFALAHYELIPPSKLIAAEFALSNCACHFNAVAAVRAGRADKAWLVWAGGNDGVVHFINSKSGKFFDETWEGSLPRASYRIIREIKTHELDNTYNILVSTKRALISSCGSMWHKIKHSRKLHGVI